MGKDTYIEPSEKENVELRKWIKELECCLGRTEKNLQAVVLGPVGSHFGTIQASAEKTRAPERQQAPSADFLHQQKVAKHIELRPDVCPYGNLLTNMRKLFEKINFLANFSGIKHPL